MTCSVMMCSKTQETNAVMLTMQTHVHARTPDNKHRANANKYREGHMLNSRPTSRYSLQQCRNRRMKNVTKGFI